MLAAFIMTLWMNMGYAMETFDPCLKETPNCSPLVMQKTMAPPKDLKGFVHFVVSDVERIKYDCVRRHSKHTKVCTAPMRHFEFHKDCNPDILKFCDWVKPGKKRILNCLKVYKKQIQESCRKHLNRRMPKLC